MVDQGGGLTAKPRESAGSKTTARYDFQVHVSLLRVLETYQTGEPFTALFDHFDDLVVIVGEQGKERLRFSQIKSKEDGAWKMRHFTSRPKAGQPPKSIIGKVYFNLEGFSGAVEAAAICSNAPLAVTLKDGTKTGMDHQYIPFSGLSDSDHKKVVAALTADFGSPLKVDYRQYVAFERVPLDLASFQLTVKARVAEFLEQQGVDDNISARPAYEALCSQLMRKTGTTVVCQTLSDLYAQKGLDRSGLSDLITRAGTRRPSILEWWPILQSQLAPSFPGLSLLRLRERCLAYWAKRKMADARALILSGVVRNKLLLATSYDGLDLRQHVDTVCDLITKKPTLSDDYDLFAVVLVELAEKPDG